MIDGFILLHRKLIEWEWYTNLNVKTLFIHCLLKANFKEKQWQGKTIKRGTFISSYGKLAVETGLSVKQVRGAFDKLRTTNEVAIKTSSQNTEIEILNYETYQIRASEGHAKGTPTGTQRASEGQQLKKDKKEKEVFGTPTNERPTIEQCLSFFKTRTTAKFEAKNFFDYYESANWQNELGRPLNWQQKAISWISRIEKKQEQPTQLKKYSKVER